MLKKIEFFKKHPLLANILNVLVLCGIAFLLALIITNYVILNGHVPTKSMENTIKADDKIMANRLQYVFNEPERGDIVVFFSPDEKAQGAESYYVKRIIGLPGENVVIRSNNVFINGQALDEPYLDELTAGEEGIFAVPEGEYFMLGDNRNDSADSRYWVNKYVPRKDILGKVFLRYSLSSDNFFFEHVESYNDYSLTSLERSHKMTN